MWNVRAIVPLRNIGVLLSGYRLENGWIMKFLTWVPQGSTISLHCIPDLNIGNLKRLQFKQHCYPNNWNNKLPELKQSNIFKALFSQH